MKETIKKLIENNIETIKTCPELADVLTSQNAILQRKLDDLGLTEAVNVKRLPKEAKEGDRIAFLATYKDGAWSVAVSRKGAAGKGKGNGKVKELEGLPVQRMYKECPYILSKDADEFVVSVDGEEKGRFASLTAAAKAVTGTESAINGRAWWSNSTAIQAS